MTRFLKKIEAKTKKPFSGVAFHGSNLDFTEFKIQEHDLNFEASDRGIYFATNKKDARQYGKFLYKVFIKLKNPKIYSEEETNIGIDIERLSLLQAGYDGFIIEYKNGDKDIIVFHPNQIKILEKSKI